MAAEAMISKAMEEKKKMKKFAAIATGLMLLMAMAAFAQGTKTKASSAKKAPAAKTMQAKGTVVSADSSSLVIAHKMSGKEEQMTFALDSSTKTTGSLVKDAVVTVHYTAEGGTNKATSIVAAAPKPAVAKKTGKR